MILVGRMFKWRNSTQLMIFPDILKMTSQYCHTAHSTGLIIACCLLTPVTLPCTITSHYPLSTSALVLFYVAIKGRYSGISLTNLRNIKIQDWLPWGQWGPDWESLIGIRMLTEVSLNKILRLSSVMVICSVSCNFIVFTEVFIFRGGWDRIYRKVGPEMLGKISLLRRPQNRPLLRPNES